MAQPTKPRLEDRGNNGDHVENVEEVVADLDSI